MNETYRDEEGYSKADELFKNVRALQIMYNVAINKLQTMFEEVGKDTNRKGNPDKYFTPSIEDIRVGYECEVTAYNEWTPKVVAADGTIDGILYSMQVDAKGCIRVPYLTKEQIEAEGWKDTTHELSINSYTFEKIGGWKDVLVHLHYNLVDRILTLRTAGNERFVNIPCKDINTFRYICKLLGI